MSWFDSLIQSIQGGFASVIDQLQGAIDGAIGGVNGTISGIQSGLTSSIYNASNYVNGTIYNATNAINGTINSVQNSINSNIGTIQGNILSRLDGATSAVYNSANNVVNAVTNNISSGLSGVLNTIYGSTSAITGGIDTVQRNLSAILGGAQSTLTGAITGAQSTLANAISGAQSFITQNIDGGLSALANGIGGLVGGLQSGIESGLSNVAQLIGTVETGVSSALANIAPDLNAIVQAIEKGVDFTPLVKLLSDPLGAFVDASTASLQERVTAKQDVIQNIANGRYASLAEVLAAIADPPPAKDPISGAVDAVYGIIALVFAFSEISPIYNRTLVTAVNEQHQTAIFDPPTLANMVNQNIATPEQAVQEGAWSGYDRARMEQLILLAGEPPGIETVLEMWRRLFISEDQTNTAILESRLKSKYLEPIKKLRYTLPPISEVINMAVREAWDDGVAAHYGYDADYPAKVAELAPQLGIDPDWIKRYWRAHWTLPSVGQLFEMLHRTKETGVTLDIVKEALRVADVPEYWRDKLTAISYATFTRVDARRMYKVGVLDRAGVKQAYLDIGYDDKRAEQLTDFTIKLEDETGQLNPDTQERQIFNALEQLYISDKATLDQLRAKAQSFGWGETAIQNEIELAQLRYNKAKHPDDAVGAGLTAQQIQRKVINETERLYLAGHRQLSDISAVMQSFGVAQDLIDLEIEYATLARENAITPSDTAATHDLAKGEIINAFKLHRFTAADAQAQLVALGVSAEDAAIMIEIATLQQANQIRGDILTNVKAAFVRGDLSETDVTGILTPFGFTSDEINGHLSTWTIDKLLKRKVVPESTLARWVKGGVMSTEDYAAELTKDGYAPQDVARFVAEHGFAGVTGA